MLTISLILPFALSWILSTAKDFYYQPFNVTRTTASGIAAYRSALTLDWLAAEDFRQRELVAAFETEASPPAKTMSSDCISYPRPTAGKVARLMLELLKNLEGDDGVLVTDLIQALVRSKLMVPETSVFDAEPDLESLVKTPGVMMGEPLTTFPRILAMVWMTATDSTTLKKHGWCTMNKVNKYLRMAKPSDVAKNMRALELVVARARYVIEEFIQHVTPLNMLQKPSPQHHQHPRTKSAPLMLRNKNQKSKTRQLPEQLQMESESFNMTTSQGMSFRDRLADSDGLMLFSADCGMGQSVSSIGYLLTVIVFTL